MGSDCLARAGARLLGTSDPIVGSNQETEGIDQMINDATSVRSGKLEEFGSHEPEIARLSQQGPNVILLYHYNTFGKWLFLVPFHGCGVA